MSKIKIAAIVVFWLAWLPVIFWTLHAIAAACGKPWYLC